MDTRIQFIAGGATLVLLAIVLELVRRRRLQERYALLWLLSALVILALTVWRGLLEDLSETVGIYYPPSALFVLAFVFVLVLLLHFSIAVSRLSDQTKVLAQRLALLEERERDRDGREMPEGEMGELAEGPPAARPAEADGAGRTPEHAGNAR